MLKPGKSPNRSQHLKLTIRLDGSRRLSQTAVSLGTLAHFVLAGKRCLAFWPLEVLMRRAIEMHFSMALRAASESLSSHVKHGMFEAFKGPTGTRQNMIFLISLWFLMTFI